LNIFSRFPFILFTNGRKGHYPLISHHSVKVFAIGNTVAATIEHSKFFSKVVGIELVECPNSLSTVYPGFRKLHPGYLLRR
jgi:hypothetical protein